ncbi:aminotransferase class IV [Planctomicrobium sp. SH527]|uniref:aminotransferase class IV n=1 Tax=Planctomicrobium sp. SH527 TaxID=3448123 RepID=UPI003F5BD57C
MSSFGSSGQSSPIAYLNGEFIPFNEAKLPVYDLGIMQGATITERMRTVHHRPYMVAEHLERLSRSLQATGIHMPQDSGPIEDAIADVARRNMEGLARSIDLSVVIFVTAGQGIGDSNGQIERSRASVCIYTAPLPLKTWNDWHQHGVSLFVPDIRHVPDECLSLQIKHRSRLHWFLADHQAQAEAPGSMALLLNTDGHVTETSSGNLFVVREQQLCTPKQSTTLPGIAQNHVVKLAEKQGWSVNQIDMTLEDVLAADEVFLTSSTYCLVPVSHIQAVNQQRQRIGNSVPGRVTKMLLDTWSAELGLSISGQAREFTHRG